MREAESGEAVELTRRSEPVAVLIGRKQYARLTSKHRLHGLLERIPTTHRYRLTRFGLRAALSYTRAYARLMRPGISAITAVGPPSPPVRACVIAKLEEAMNLWCQEAKLVA